MGVPYVDIILSMQMIAFLDLHGNHLTILHATSGNVSTFINLDVSANHLSSL